MKYLDDDLVLKNRDDVWKKIHSSPFHKCPKNGEKKKFLHKVL